MSDVKEQHWEIYEKVCKDRFQKIEDKLDTVHAVVTNGLVDKVKSLQRWNWFIITGIIGLLAGMVIQLLRHA